jgi:hypothetical protein
LVGIAAATFFSKRYTVVLSVMTLSFIKFITDTVRLTAISQHLEGLQRARFPAPVQTDPEAHPASYTMGTGSFQGVKWPGIGFDHPSHPALRFKKE